MERQFSTRVVMMSSSLMKLYEVRRVANGPEFQPITFYRPQECLDLLVHPEASEVELEEENSAVGLEQKMGELELRLSFFTDAHKWH